MPRASTPRLDRKRDIRTALLSLCQFLAQFLFASKAQQIIESHSKKKNSGPLFLYLPFQNVHAPLQVPKQYSDLYPNEHNENRKIFSGDFEYLKAQNFWIFFSVELTCMKLPINYLFGQGMMSALDEAVGNITKTLRETGMFNNTIIFFTADVKKFFCTCIAMILPFSKEIDPVRMVARLSLEATTSPCAATRTPSGKEGPEPPPSSEHP